MTPEKLEGWAEYFTEIARDHPAQGYQESFAELGKFLTRLAAKMREPDGWEVGYVINRGSDREWTATTTRDYPDHDADSCRPILYLDSLGGDE